MVCAIVPQVAINKPSGLQVLPGGLFQQRTVLKQLEWDNEEKEKHLQACLASVSSSDETRLWKPAPVHRLGRGTSGFFISYGFNPTRENYYCNILMACITVSA